MSRNVGALLTDTPSVGDRVVLVADWNDLVPALRDASLTVTRVQRRHVVVTVGGAGYAIRPECLRAV